MLIFSFVILTFYLFILLQYGQESKKTVDLLRTNTITVKVKETSSFLTIVSPFASGVNVRQQSYVNFLNANGRRQPVHASVSKSLKS